MTTPIQRPTARPRVTTPIGRTTPTPVYRGTPRARTDVQPVPRTRTTPGRTAPAPVYRTTPRIRTTPRSRAGIERPDVTRGGSLTDRYAAPPRSVRIGRSDARDGHVPAAPDYRARLRDLYDRRAASTRLDADTVRTRGEAVSRSLTPRYAPKLRSDVGAVGGRSDATPTEPRVRERQPRGDAPRTTPRGDVAAQPRVRPVADRYHVPGRDRGDAERAGEAPTESRRAPGLRPRTARPSARPAPNLRGSSRSPTLRPVAPPDVLGNARRGGRGDGPTLRGRGRSGGLGARFSDHWYDYNNWSVAGSHRYLYGCYHWSGHSAAFWPTHCGWGSYWYPYRYCGSWYRYWYNCRSSFTLYWNSRYPSASRLSWWWPSDCYLPGSWLGFSGFASWSDDYVDWSYSPSTTYVVPSTTYVVPTTTYVADETVEVEEADPAESLAALAERHLKLGDYYFRRGRYEEAAESYVRALAYAPDDGALHFVLADALFAQGDYHYAAYMIGKALELDPALASATADKREFYGDPGEFERQLETLRKYLAEKPYDAAAHLVLAYNLRFSDQSAEATAAFRRVLEIDPGNRAARAFLEAVADGASEAAPAPVESSGEGK